jgi:hypothetical protein
MTTKMQRQEGAQLKNEMCGASKAERAERSGMPRFFFGYFLCSNDKESNNKLVHDFPPPTPSKGGHSLNYTSL